MSGIIDTVGSKSGIVGSDVYPAGMPIKVYSATYTGEAAIPESDVGTIPDATFVTVGGTASGNLSITTETPVSSSSKYLLMANISHSVQSSGVLIFRFYDGSTAIPGVLSDTAGSTVRGSFGPGHWSTGPSVYPVTTASMTYLYSPASASAVTLSVKGGSNQDVTFYYNRSAHTSTAEWQARSTSSFTIMEIAG